MTTAHRRPTADLTFDVADHKGRLGLHGFGIDWAFPADQQEAPNGLDAMSPVWWLQGCEIKSGLDVLTLHGFAPIEDVIPAQWSFPKGAAYWTTERPPGLPGNKLFLSFGNSAPNSEGGLAVCTSYVAPRFCVRLRDFAPPYGQTGEVVTAVEYRGMWEDEDEELQWNAYRWEFPLHDETRKNPLLKYATGSIDDDTVWTEVARFERCDLSGLARDGKPRTWNLWVEWIDGAFRMEVGGASEPWIYWPASDPTYLFPPTPTGVLAVEFLGHAGMCNPQPIHYAETGTATPYQYSATPTWTNPVNNYKWCRSNQGRGNVTVVQDVSGDAEGGWEARPLITLTRAVPNDTPAVRVVHEYHEAVLSGGNSEPVSTQTRATALTAALADPCELQELWWRRIIDRGWEFGASLRDPHAYWATYLKWNMECVVKAGWQGTNTQIMVGYLSSPEVARSVNWEMGITSGYTIHGRDYVGGRMQDKKFMVWPCSPLGHTYCPEQPGVGVWHVDDWAQWWLTRCGFGFAFTCPADIVVEPTQIKEQNFAFDHGTQVHEGLDKVFKSVGLSPLTTRTDGGLETKVLTDYVAPADFELDEDTATGDERIEEVTVSPEDDSFRNFIVALHKRGGAVAFNEASIIDGTDDYFIGDVWMEVLEADDASDPEVQATLKLIERMKRRRLVRWTRDLKPDLPPGSWVNVNLDNVGVAANTVLRVIQDEAHLRAGEFSPTSSFLCEMREVTAP